ncbi:unnamed protein product [Cylindrotheca closterium]|uniref:Peptidase S1 domain-containing protein n=1 Tax=Cylindrotheca closterium TaxID=2856 RepID=A0AAD2CMG1_9STRA|nr:unnamed protein product [Cylindrotheca closterium]
MKIETFFIVTLLALSAAEAHNVRSREYLEEKRSRAKKEHHSKQPRVIGGDQSALGDFPYYVDMNYCGGALIAPRVVLSCAHCVAEDVYYEGYQFIVNGYKPGTTAGTNGGMWRTVEEKIQHPDYVTNDANQTADENDIALYLLSEPVHGLSAYISLNEDPNWPPDDTPLTLMGMGDHQEDDGSLEDVDFLNDVVILVVNINECKERHPQIDPNKQICAGAVGYGSCMGDSGSPLVFRHKGNHHPHIHVGIVSYGDKACNTSPNSQIPLFVRVHLSIGLRKLFVNNGRKKPTFALEQVLLQEIQCGKVVQ